jgi:hypothetical protein
MKKPLTPHNESDDAVYTQVITSSRDLDDYDILSTMTMSAAAPHHTTERFRKFIWAAMATHGLGNSSIDYVMKRYGRLCITCEFNASI